MISGITPFRHGSHASWRAGLSRGATARRSDNFCHDGELSDCRNRTGGRCRILSDRESDSRVWRGEPMGAFEPVSGRHWRPARAGRPGQWPGGARKLSEQFWRSDNRHCGSDTVSISAAQGPVPSGSSPRHTGERPVLSPRQEPFLGRSDSCCGLVRLGAGVDTRWPPRLARSADEYPDEHHRPVELGIDLRGQKPAGVAAHPDTPT
jgi:hypothetical protein